MPFLHKRSTLTPQNARSSDVAKRMVESLAPMQQAKMEAAFKVQGQPGILYNRLTSGVPCSCVTANKQVSILSPDGKASNGAINRVLMGNSNFGIAPYDPTNRAGENEEDFLAPTPEGIQDWGADFNGGELSGFIDRPLNAADTNQDFAFPDDAELDAEFGHLGVTDIACPICFGSGYVGGFQPLRGFRLVVSAVQMETASNLALPQFELDPGSHSFTATLPLGVVRVEAFRAYQQRNLVPFEVAIDGESLQVAGGRKSVMPYFDGKPHTITITCRTPITHFEIQCTTSSSHVNFEMPKRSKSADLSLLERGESFQVLLSPEVPHVDTLDVIVEASQGKVLVVQGVTPWKTKAQQNLGWEIQVRVAQPQELWYILPTTKPTTAQRTANPVTPSKSYNQSGMDGFSF